MKDEDFPALYKSANQLAIRSQNKFLRALKIHLFLLVIAAALSVADVPHWGVALIQALVLLGALACAIYLTTKRPERLWYAGRAVAESIKTVTWRYMSRAEPFQGEDDFARSEFSQKLKAIVEQNRDVAGSLTGYLDQAQITRTMLVSRSMSLDERKNFYAEHRISNQLSWYAAKAVIAKKNSARFFTALIAVNSFAVIFALVRIRFPDAAYWPTDILVALSACFISWMQARRFSELSTSYALAAHEISLIREQAFQAASAQQFSSFVGDTENAFSREHTQWVARKDV